jgi:putative hydrolase of the HAD superfamily
MARLLDHFSVVLLDLNSTFMFGEDRFGPEEDFHATYRSLGGAVLGREQVQTAIRNCYDAMSRIYQSLDHYDDFPSVAETLHQQGDVPLSELDLLEKVFAIHERGIIPSAYAELLFRLGKTHQLGLVSNLWSRKRPWLAEFERLGISELFACKIFSSDNRSIKPSPALFKAALRSFPPDASILFAGDNLKRDIMPAKSLGLATAWINPKGDRSPCADYVLPNLLLIETEAEWVANERSTSPPPPESSGNAAAVPRAPRR